MKAKNKNKSKDSTYKFIWINKIEKEEWKKELLEIKGSKLKSMYLKLFWEETEKIYNC